MLVNHTIKGLHQGVSQQSPELRFETQCNEMINCIPNLTRGIVRRNPTELEYSLGLQISKDAFIYSYDRGANDDKFIFIIENGKYSIYDVNAKAMKATQVVHSYLNTGTTLPRDAFSAVTVADYTFLVNKTITVNLSGTPEGTLNDEKAKAFLWINKTQVISLGTDPDGTNRLTGLKYTLTYNGTPKFFGASLTEDSHIAASVATSLATQHSISAKDSFVYTLTAPTQWEHDDSAGGTASIAVNGRVRNSNLLPDTIPTIIGDVTVKVEGTSAAEDDDYWLKWSATDGTWGETVKPGLDNTLDSATMPHVFVHNSAGNFIFGEYEELTADGLAFNGTTMWGKRTVGDEVTAITPSFVGQKLRSIFFHRNRLGLLSEDSVCLSELGEYGNFFPTTVRQVLDTDNIDLTLATTNVSKLLYAEPSNNSLMLFSPSTQFSLTSGDQPLTPLTATIDVVSNYNISSSVKPKYLGNIMYFISESGGYSQLFGYRLYNGPVIPEANSFTLHTPSYIPNNVITLVGHSVLGDNFILSNQDRKTLFVYSTVEENQKPLQASIHKWVFADDIISARTLDNRLYLVQDNGTTTYVSSISLELPGDNNTIYLDLGTLAYESSIEFSKWYIKDNNNIGTRRGRLQIRTLLYTLTKGSRFMTTVTNETILGILSDADYLLTTGIWVDTGLWCDTCPWISNPNVFIRQFKDDSKVTVMGNADITQIKFSNNPDAPDKGFELDTINFEGNFTQRSTRI